MTACFKIMRAIQQQQPRPNPDVYCQSCVYFSKNLDETEYPALTEKPDACGLEFLPGDDGCTGMRTDNCSVRRPR